MKAKIIVAVLLLKVVTSLFAQGLVNFANTPNTLVSAHLITFTNGQRYETWSAISGPRDSYYFALLTGTPGDISSFTFTGLYATNTGVDGLFSVGTVAVPNWAPGTTKSYEVAGWAADLGPAFNPAWIRNNPPDSLYLFGVSAVGVASAGADTPQIKLSAFIIGDSINVSWSPLVGTLQSSPSLGLGETWSTVGTTNPATVKVLSSNAKFFRVLPPVYPTPNLFDPASVPGFTLSNNPL
jgi:hypothetical protein